jgi:hypothetical protein
MSKNEIIGFLSVFTAAVIAFAGWVTHIVVCIQQQMWLLLIGGAILVPIGIIHGIGSWFGLF